MELEQRLVEFREDHSHECNNRFVELRELTEFIGAANTIYGILLVLCIIFMPQGVVGALQGLKLKRTLLGKAAEAKP